MKNKIIPSLKIQILKAKNRTLAAIVALKDFWVGLKNLVIALTILLAGFIYQSIIFMLIIAIYPAYSLYLLKPSEIGIKTNIVRGLLGFVFWLIITTFLIRAKEIYKIDTDHLYTIIVIVSAGLILDIKKTIKNNESNKKYN